MIRDRKVPVIKLEKKNDSGKFAESPHSGKERFILSKFYFSTNVIPLFVKFFLKTNLTPNQITCLSFICYIFAGLVFCFGQHIYLIFGAVLIQLGLILDNVDGTVANKKGMVTNYGKWLDVSTDRIGQTFMVFCAGFGMFYASRNIIHLYAGLIGSMFFVFTTLAVQTAHLVKPEKYISATTKHIKQKFGINLADFLRGGGATLIWITLGALLNLMFYVFIFYFVLFYSVYLVRIFAIFRKHITD